MDSENEVLPWVADVLWLIVGEKEENSCLPEKWLICRLVN